jgi:cytoplasmic iron level regulating protein YaaA (DUF328/UPF0246 family)
MIAILSPAKSLDYETERSMPAPTRPRLEEHAARLVARAKEMSVEDLMSKMKISQALAELNHGRWQGFESQEEKPAIQVFDGDVYTGLDAKSMDEDDILFAQDHLRILSGLYGALRPLDLMRPYRLEMGTKRFPEDHKLSIWWDTAVADLLVEDMDGNDDRTILNLASEEYYASIKGRLPEDVRVIDVKFMTGDRFITMHAKVARGTMARWMIDNRITDIEAMKGFDYDGYAFVADESDDDAWTFRKEA